MTLSVNAKAPQVSLTIFEQKQQDSGLTGFQFSAMPNGCWVDADEAQRVVDYIQSQLPAMLAANRRLTEANASGGSSNDETLTTEALSQDQAVSAGHA